MYTYVFFRPSANALTLPEGITGPLQQVDTPQLSAVVEAGLDWDAIAADEQQLIQAVVTHDRVICALFEQVTVLPLRFGTRFEPPETLQTYLETHHQAYQEKLFHLADKGEYLLKATPLEIRPETELPTEAQGRAYFLAKKQRYQTQADEQRQQQQQMQTLVAAIAQAYPAAKVSESPDRSHRIYLLLKENQRVLLNQQLAIWQNQCYHWDINLLGPLPPYHFV